MTNFEQWKESLNIEEWAKKFAQIDDCMKCPAHDFCCHTDIMPPIPEDPKYIDPNKITNCCITRFITWGNQLIKK